MRGLEAYQDQLDKMMRWYERFEEIDKGSKQTRSSDYYFDVV
ncbi:MAG: hypothetical protein V3U16_02070 [Candidatus Neomarinimicrobiota bacterium]